MQEIIKKIIEMDEEARKLKNAAEQERISAQKEIFESKQKIHNEYIERARQRADMNAELEQKAADEQWAKTQEKHKAIREALENNFQQSCDAWAEEIAANVLRNI